MASTEHAGTPADDRSGWLPLQLASEHLNEIEALWHLRRNALFSTELSEDQLRRLDGRLAVHLEALRLDPEETIAEAEIRLHSVAVGEVFAAAFVLARLATDRLISDRMTLRVERSDLFPLCDALRHGPSEIGSSFSLRDATLTDAASFHAPIPRGIAMGSLWSTSALRRSALLAVARHPDPPEFAVDELEVCALDADSPWRLEALYGFALAGPPRFEDLVDRLADEVFAIPRALLCLGMFGSARVAARLEAHIADKGPSVELAQALGLAGLPRSLPLLAELLDHPEPRLRMAALQALYVATGERFETTPTPDEPPATLHWPLAVVQQLERLNRGHPPARGLPDPQAARAYLASGALDLRSTERYHLGIPLLADPPDEPMALSYRWLRALATPSDSPLRFEVPDALFGEGYGALELPRHHLLFLGEEA